MRSTIVPAQITSVEDKITSFLNLKQIVILIINLVLIMIQFLVIPPFVKFSLLKVLLAFILSALLIPMTFKYKEIILLDHLVLIISYNLRPKTYVLIKDDEFLLDKEFSKFNSISKNVLTENSQLFKKLNFSYSYGKRGEVYVQFFK